MHLDLLHVTQLRQLFTRSADSRRDHVSNLFAPALCLLGSSCVLLVQVVQPFAGIPSPSCSEYRTQASDPHCRHEARGHGGATFCGRGSGTVRGGN